MRALEIRGLFHRYRDGTVLRGLDFTVEAGEVLGVFGPNSAGKTTLLRLLCGTLVPAAGEILLFGRPLAEWPRRELARTVALVPQEAAVAFSYTVLEVVLMGRYPTAGRSASRPRPTWRRRRRPWPGPTSPTWRGPR